MMEKRKLKKWEKITWWKWKLKKMETMEYQKLLLEGDGDNGGDGTPSPICLEAMEMMQVENSKFGEKRRGIELGGAHDSKACRRDGPMPENATIDKTSHPSYWNTIRATTTDIW
ncbi:hypothetical protein HAX54_017652 [Datura stramonium]|uniref:Uncharacterized protein n=1 Tax=Datura stramonium TaxID=4076 RepID=A0ABS8UL26_DATST|nr:hypothetical protein [Datura stramonium]